ncbi:unnamed protein product, partial [Polarella glacialis]
ENAVSELLSLGPVAWVRCHVSEEQVESGERLVKDVAARLSFNLTCSGRDGLSTVISAERLDRLWAEARERFLAPWIFGLSEHEEVLLELARRTAKPFWALTEYGP